jgi:uncharacterized protein YuzE
MKISYDKVTGALYFKILENTEIVESEEIRDGIVLDLDAQDRAVGIEILTSYDPKLEDEIKKIADQISN